MGDTVQFSINEIRLVAPEEQPAGLNHLKFNYLPLPFIGAEVGLPPQPTTEITLRARTRAQRTRFIVISQKAVTT